MRNGSIVFFFLLIVSPLQAKTAPRFGLVPDEIESVGGHALGLGNDGVAALSEQASVRTNPAMITFEKHYKLSAGYHWPTFGREFYQVGIVDSKTSPLAAGILYTQTQDDYEPFSPSMNKLDDRLNAYYDSPVKRRVSLGLGQAFQKLAFGVGGQYIERYAGSEIEKGTTLGVGVAGLVTSTLRFGVSAENLANKNLKDVAPKTYRAGLAYTMFGGDITAHLDFKQRERVAQELPLNETGNDILTLEDVEGINLGKPEQMVTGSFTARVQDLLRLMAAYGQSLDQSPRRSLSGGIALVNANFSLSYLVSRPYMLEQKSHQAINLSMSLSM